MSRKGRGMDNCGKRPADGDVWIENGKFKVCDPEAGGRPAVLIPVPEVKLLINGKPTGQMTTVSAADEIADSVSTTAAPPFSISVAADKMTASLCLNSRAFIRRVLEDTAPQNQLQPRVKEERADIVPGASPSDIIRELNRNGVSFGVDYVAIREALSGNVFDTPLPVAKGKKPVPGTDARMEYHVERDITRVQTDLTEEKVDYHAVLQIPSVIPGQLLATKHPLQPGENGIAVTGEVVPPPPARDIFLVIKQGATEVAEAGVTRIYAAISGRPAIEETGKFKVAVGVQEIYSHAGDVDLSSGDINFNGDVEISGNVTETMSLNAGGSVEVFGNVAGAVVNAGGNITVRGSAIRSNLMSGGVQAVYARLLPAAESLLESIPQLVAAVGQLLERAGSESRNELQLGRLIYVLLNAKFRNIPDRIEKITEEMAAAGCELAAEVTEPVRAAGKLFGGDNSLRISDLTAVVAVQRELAEAAAYLRNTSAKPVTVSLAYAINTEIVTSGDVRIGRQGGYNTTVSAAGRVDVEGIFRSGEINAGDDVTIEETGSAVGVLTKVRTAAGKTISIARAFENTVVQVGKQVHKIETEQRRLRINIDPGTGRLELN
ncbi:MAG: DUF342 domain-containing protein [bacterium]